MQGPTWTMPSIFSTNSALPRSHSSSNIPELGNIDYKGPAVRIDDELPRSASFSCIPSLESIYPTDAGLHRVSSAETPPATFSEKDDKVKDSKDEKTGTRTKEERPKLERLGRRKSLVARPKSWIQKVKGSPERTESSEGVSSSPSNIPPVPQIPKATRDKTKTVTESFATFAKKSWITSSRSPSPSRNSGREGDQDGNPDDTSKSASTVSSSSPRRSMAAPRIESPAPVKTSDSPLKQANRSSTTLSKNKSRPQSVLMNFTTFNSANSSTSSLPRSSVDNKSTPSTSTDKIPPLPKTHSTERLHSIGIEIPTQRKKDELWSAFRSLENDFSKFQSKSWSLKTNVVRAALLPFLRNHASHSSNKTLRPEDLDRRVNILNKWWMGLLEVLDGRQNQAVSGVDRPVLLEAVTGIMTRPEWRQTPAFAPLSDQSPNSSTDGLPLRNRKSSASLKSSASQFMAESVYHNVRNTFIQNLLFQMSYVVDRMSLRHAPASLVTFCGKASAYAFFFVPGVADALVRIWRLQAEILRRAADELGLPRRLNRSDTQEVAIFFPSQIRQLAWTSVKSMATQLRNGPDLPILASKIAWNGPWTARWCGRDSDLFFVFAKHYHILAEEFLPSDLSFAEKSRAPGFVLVQAQILTTLDATIHRQPPVEPLPITFDDVLAGADASATALPLPSNNSARLMAENRLIMLLRDFLSERPSEYDAARLTFAEAFSNMTQAAARRTSVFDHNACFVLCDFMEESLALYMRFYYFREYETDFINWRFWMDVCKKMLESQNSLSEIRLFAFLFGAWNVIGHDERRKEVICLEWLLTEETFDKFFNHWCPMVRAYYMRLLCWRLCREHGEATDLDTKIFSTISARAKASWAHYLFLKQAAEKSCVLPPSTAPCHPAPGRRLLIIRNDNQSPAASQFLGFDGIMSPSRSGAIATTQATSHKKHSSFATLSKFDAADSSAPKLTMDSSTGPNKKRWTFMTKVLPSNFSTGVEGSPSPTQSRAVSPTKTLEEARKETAIARSRPGLPRKSSSTDSDTPPATAATHRAYSFKFSLEWSQHFDKAPTNGNGRTGGGSGGGLNVGNERRLSPPRLPAAAQAWLGARVPGTSREVVPKDPAEGGASAEKIARAKYAGRALSEWTLIVGECNNFADRRRNEGVPGLKWVEVPTLGVEGFRKFAA
ncbi:non sense mediated decay [Hyphodiscus hymeniophilus]|uniref:Non sense mediated decay n=1 Tax=Hyphodiscus hymeniophilus TaxID=353542 RepID=A0A9P6VKV7_9HELO|nr:non sense mediated decay [Hyphodiscus hymeniophilus]